MDEERYQKAVELLESKGEEPTVRRVAEIAGGRWQDITDWLRRWRARAPQTLDLSVPPEQYPTVAERRIPPMDRECEPVKTARQAVADSYTKLKSWNVQPTIEKIVELTGLPAEEVTPYLESLTTGQPTAAERSADADLQARYLQDFQAYQRQVADTRALVKSWRACLRCQQGFLSTGNDHRICNPCKQKAEAQPSDEVVYSCVRGTLD
jgi:hypothetical protein